MLQIVQATTPEQVEHARDLIRAFIAWARVRLEPDLHRVERYFAPDVVEPELAALPGRFAPPSGSLLVAYDDIRRLGVVGMRDLGEGVCEMKRMYVADGSRGMGVGKALVARLLDDARVAGHRIMRLDTSMHQHEAMALYEKAGFRPIDPYYDVPDALRDWLRYYEVAL